MKLHLEWLEERCLLSAEAVPAITFLAQPALTNNTITGFTPAQIRHAYGFDQVPSLSANYNATAGAGQTIAIVDVYDDPNIAGDLKVFDKTFGLPDPNFIKVNENGSRTGPFPMANSTWSGEISLDVEWAHAIAPAATILLVEASSAYANDILPAINTARNWAGVSVVSMSWGFSERYDMGPSEPSYDSYLTTPAGHTPVTFTAATLDNGAGYGVYWPSVSPNVLAVGGTSLTVNANNSYNTETGWSSSTGGVSLYETQPSWQKQLVTQSTTNRTVPDVSYHADNSRLGFAVYDTVPYNRQTGWFNAGGDSAWRTQWAALVALADQQRGTALDGPAQTLPALYQLAGQNYALYFHDVTRGSNGYAASAGYDLVTGIGSPRADQLIPALANWTAATTSSGTASGSNAGGSASPAFSVREAESPPATSLSQTTSADALFGDVARWLANTSAKEWTVAAFVPALLAGRPDVEGSGGQLARVVNGLPVAGNPLLDGEGGDSNHKDEGLFEDPLASELESPVVA